MLYCLWFLPTSTNGGFIFNKSRFIVSFKLQLTLFLRMSFKPIPGLVDSLTLAKLESDSWNYENK